MKRTFTANIDGQIFHIDEDAYNLLMNYLDQLRQTFAGAEGDEIVGDIESRIREHFEDRLGSGTQVISLADVRGVITTMGSPEDISGESDENNSGTSSAESTPPPFISVNLPGKKKLYRNMQNKVFGGIFGGIGSYLGWNANIMRLLYVILACYTYLWPMVIVYLLAWMIIPAAVTASQVLQMNGKPVNVGTMGQAVIADTNKSIHPDGNNFWTCFFGAIGKIIIGFVGMISVTVGLGVLIVFLALLAGMIAYGVYGNVYILDGLDFFEGEWTMLYVSTAMVWLLFALIIAISLTWLASCVIFRARGASRTTIITGVIMSIILFAAGVVLSAVCTSLI